MTNGECILCGSDSLRRLQDINVSDLCATYALWLPYDIRDEFDEIRLIKYLECPACGLKFFSPAITGSTAFYDALSKQMGEHYYQEDKSEYRFASRFINENDSVLDVGSGSGQFCKYVRGRYTGLDFNPRAIDLAKRGGVPVIDDSLEEHVGKLTAPYSAITAFQVIEHVENPKRFIQKLLEALSADGLLILSVPSEDSYVGLMENAVLNMPPHHVTRWSNTCLRNVAKIFNLRLVAMEHEELSPIHFDSFISLLANKIVRALFRWNQTGLIDVSLKKKVIDRLSVYAKPILQKVFANDLLWPHGHSVTVAFKK